MTKNFPEGPIKLSGALTARLTKENGDDIERGIETARHESFVIPLLLSVFAKDADEVFLGLKKTLESCTKDLCEILLNDAQRRGLSFLCSLHTGNASTSPLEDLRASLSGALDFLNCYERPLQCFKRDFSGSTAGRTRELALQGYIYALYQLLPGTPKERRLSTVVEILQEQMQQDSRLRDRLWTIGGEICEKAVREHLRRYGQVLDRKSKHAQPKQDSRATRKKLPSSQTTDTDNA